MLACGEGLHAMQDLPRETASGGIVEVHTFHVADESACAVAIARCRSVFGGVDGLVWSGGDGAAFGAAEEATERALRDLFEAHFFGPFRLIQAVAGQLREQRHGRVVVVTSAAGRVALPLTGAFSASQYALEGMCDALRLELRTFGVDVALVEPGIVRRALVGQAKKRLRPTDLFDLAPHSPYLELASALTDAVEDLMLTAATPREVAAVIERAMTGGRPRARYTVKRRTAALLWARKLLPDRVVDGRLVKSLDR